MTTAHERKQQERHARRRRIQRAARTVFAEKGYAKTSIEQIAREASLSVGAIYLYFRSKEDLYISLLEETLEGFDAELSRLRGTSESPDAKLRSVWSFLTNWAQNDVESTRVLRLVAQPNIRKQLSDEVAESVAKGLGLVRNHISSLIDEGVQGSVFRVTTTAQSTDLVWTLFLGVLLANDARANLELEGGSFDELANGAFAALETSLRAGASRVSAAA